MAPSKSKRNEKMLTNTSVPEHTTTPSSVSSTSLPVGKEPSTIMSFTPIEEIPSLVQKLRENYHGELKSHSLQFRLNQLRNIYFAVHDNINEICDALQRDFGRAPTETITLEYAPLMKEIVHIMAHLHEWMRPEPVTNLPISMKMNPIYIEKEPLGVVLVIAPFNYPLLLSLSSLVAAIAAGNSVVLKISELTPHFTTLLTRILSKALDPTTFAMINGGIAETTALLEQKFDKIMYTGSIAVGTIIAKKAAETLTPVLLELGGKSPAFVLDDVTDADIDVVARRICWGRFTNAGQTCVAIDYVLVPEKLKEKLVRAIVKVVNEQFYPLLDAKDPTYTHVIHMRAFESLKKMIEQTKGTIVAGGHTNISTRYISPTVIDDVDWDDSTMKQEIFGPVLPILSYSDLKLAVREVVRRHDTPLALYIFTSGPTGRAKNKQVDYIRSAVRSGGAIVNDSILHVALDNAPFGGIGNSGQGSYHGYYSFRAFTHERTIMEQNLNTDFALKVRYPPYEDKKTMAMRQSMTAYNGRVWFNRTGDVSLGGPGLIWSAWTSLLGVGALLYHVVNAI